MPYLHYGKWRARWNDENGKQSSATFDDFKSADFFEKRKKIEAQEIRRGRSRLRPRAIRLAEERGKRAVPIVDRNELLTPRSVGASQSSPLSERESGHSRAALLYGDEASPRAHRRSVRIHGRSVESIDRAGVETKSCVSKTPLGGGRGAGGLES